MTKRILIIGGNSAGASAAAKARRLDPDAAITLLEQDREIAYAACALPYYLSGVVPDHRSFIKRTPAFFREKQNIEVFSECRAVQIDLQKQEVHVENIKDGSSNRHPYDILVVASGGKLPDFALPGANLPGIHSFRTLDDAFSLRDTLSRPHIKTVLVVGAGYIGLEIAESLKSMGKKVAVVEMENQVMNTLDPDMAAIIEAELDQQGVFLHKNEKVLAFKANQAGRLKAVLTDKAEHTAEAVVIAAGVAPNTALAGAAGIPLGYRGAIKVNRRLETGVQGVYAAGDCAETYHRLLDRNLYLPLGTTANRQGRLVGENACGREKEYAGSLGSAVAKIFNLTAGRTGLSASEAAAYGLAAESAIIQAYDHAPYYPGAQPLHVKLIYRSDSGSLLGGQLIGSAEAAKRVDVLAAAIWQGLTVEELAALDMCYAPPYAQVWDALQVAANRALKT